MNLFNFRKNQSGVMAVEFALLMPILLLLFLGGFEITRYVLINQKISKTAASMSDLISRLPSATEEEIENSFNAVQHLMAPYYKSGEVKVIISNVMRISGNNVMNWQRCGGGNFDVQSKFGEPNDNVALPNGFTLETSEDTIIAEIFYEFKPIIAPKTVAAKVLYKVRYTKPRLGALNKIIDDSGETNC